MPGENCYDERPNNPIQQFRVEVFRPILDQIVSSLKERFSDENIGLMKVTPYFSSDSFKDSTILSNNSSILDGINYSPLTKLVNVSEIDLKWELASFASLYTAHG